MDPGQEGSAPASSEGSSDGSTLGSSAGAESKRRPRFLFKDILPAAARGLTMPATEEEEARYRTADHHKLDILARKQQLAAKKRMGERVFWLVTSWLIVVMITLWMQGSGCFLPFTGESFNLSDAVLITLITTTTANIALFLTIVIKHLFPREVK